jgi:hypothetical protein
MYGWLLIWKKTFSNQPIVDLGLSFGGLEMTFGRVSRMLVREGTMKPPAGVMSQ